jgi:imidazolonepropionase-like amidohydrolase
MTVKLRKGRFSYIEKTKIPRDLAHAQAEGAIVVDVKDYYLCPGLIDCKNCS